MARRRATTKTCRGKRRYRDRQEAIRELQPLTSRSTRAQVPVRAYLCPVCKGHHLTKRKTPA